MNTAPKPFAARAMDSVPKNGRKTITGYAQDADGDALTFTPLNPVNASLVQLNTKTVLFVPAKDFTGTASFTWQIEDGKGGVATQDVIVEVFPSSFTYRPIIIGAGKRLHPSRCRQSLIACCPVPVSMSTDWLLFWRRACDAAGARPAAANPYPAYPCRSSRPATPIPEAASKPDAEAERERELSSMKTRLEQLARPVRCHMAGIF